MRGKNILIVEDEAIVAKDIEKSLQRLGYKVVGIASNGDKVKQLLTEVEPDIILMDIMIKGDLSGIEVSEYVKENFDIPVIFLTAYADDNTLEKAKITEPYGYILKPFKEIDLHTTIEMAVYKHQKTSELKKELEVYSSMVSKNENGQDFVFVKSKSRLVKIAVDKLLYVEALKDYVIFNTAKEKYTIHNTMKDVEMKLPSNVFARVHRSYIININHIESIENVVGRLRLDGVDKSIPIGGSYKDELLSRFNLL